MSDELDRDYSQHTPVPITFTAAELVALFKFVHPLQKNPDPSALVSVLAKLDGAMSVIRSESARIDHT